MHVRFFLFLIKKRRRCTCEKIWEHTEVSITILTKRRFPKKIFDTRTFSLFIGNRCCRRGEKYPRIVRSFVRSFLFNIFFQLPPERKKRPVSVARLTLSRVRADRHGTVVPFESFGGRNISLADETGRRCYIKLPSLNKEKLNLAAASFADRHSSSDSFELQNKCRTTTPSKIFGQNFKN